MPEMIELARQRSLHNCEFAVMDAAATRQREKVTPLAAGALSPAFFITESVGRALHMQFARHFSAPATGARGREKSRPAVTRTGCGVDACDTAVAPIDTGR